MMLLDLKQVAAVLLASASLAQAAVQGFDISHYQSSVNFAAAYNSGARFVMIKVCFL
jgi:GH25 family lysozyme M1 (1,4-beta-N-acetylmuramidase)